MPAPLAPAELLAWITASAHHSPDGCVVPLPADPAVWEDGVALGGRLLWLQTRGARTGGEPADGTRAAKRPRMPGGRRPYVRAALPERGLPQTLDYDRDEEALLLGSGRIAPVPPGAWDYHAGGVRVLDAWFAQRTGAGAEPAEAGSLAALRPATWPQEWTSDLLELITVLALLAELSAPVRGVAPADRGRSGDRGGRAAGGRRPPRAALRASSGIRARPPRRGPRGAVRPAVRRRGARPGARARLPLTPGSLLGHSWGANSGPGEENVSWLTTRFGGQVMFFGGQCCPVRSRNQAGGSYIGGS